MRTFEINSQLQNIDLRAHLRFLKSNSNEHKSKKRFAGLHSEDYLASLLEGKDALNTKKFFLSILL
jgi:hypothetical protein